jgi:hypothetical protein
VAELDATGAAGLSSCCTPERQRSCCEPSEKDGCCSADSNLCGCADGEEGAALALPMLADCGLDEEAAGAQLARYRLAGAGAMAIERTPRRVVAQIDRRVPDGLIAELVDVERGCCPFFGLGWEPERRRLEISVTSNERERALDAIASALFQAQAGR